MSENLDDFEALESQSNNGIINVYETYSYQELFELDETLVIIPHNVDGVIVLLSQTDGIEEIKQIINDPIRNRPANEKHIFAILATLFNEYPKAISDHNFFNAFMEKFRMKVNTSHKDPKALKRAMNAPRKAFDDALLGANMSLKRIGIEISYTEESQIRNYIISKIPNFDEYKEIPLDLKPTRHPLKSIFNFDTSFLISREQEFVLQVGIIDDKVHVKHFEHLNRVEIDFLQRLLSSNGQETELADFIYIYLQNIGFDTPIKKIYAVLENNNIKRSEINEVGEVVDIMYKLRKKLIKFGLTPVSRNGGGYVLKEYNPHTYF